MRYEIVACDKCGAREDKKAVTAWTARRGHSRYNGELCETCWAELLDTFHPSARSKSRHKIVITDIEDIPEQS